MGTPVEGFDSEGMRAEISELRRQLARAAAESHSAGDAAYHLAAIVESSDDAIISKTLDGTVLSWNAAAERIYGYSEQEMIGQSMSRLLPSDRQFEEADILARLQAGERVHHVESIRIRKDGHPIHVSLTISPVRDGSGRIVAASHVARDITDRKRAEEERERLVRQREASRQELEILYAVSQVLAGELDAERLIQAVTDAAREATGAMVGACFYKLLDANGAAQNLYTVSGVPPDQLSRSAAPPETHLFEALFKEERVIRSDDITQDQRDGQNPLGRDMPLGDLPVRSYLAVPLAAKSGESLGGLVLGHSEPGMFSDREARIVSGLAVHASIALDNARLYETARRDRERAERSEARRRMALDAGRMGTWDWDLGSGIVSWSEMMSRLLGFGPHAATGSYEQWLGILHPEDRNRVRDVIAAAVEDGARYDTEFRVVWPDGSEHWLAARGEVVQNAEGRPVMMGGVSWDTTELKRAEQERDRALDRALAAERESRGILESITDGFAAVDSGYCITYLNPTAEQMLGRASADLATLSLWEAFPALVGTDFERQCRRVMDRREAAGFTAYLSAWQRWFDVKAYPTRDNGLAIYFRDVTEIKEARERLELVLNSVKLGFWYCDLPFDKLHFNATCKEHFWIAPEAEVTFEGFLERLHPDDRESTREAIERALRRRELFDVEYRAVPDDGRLRWIRAIGRSFYDENGAPTRFDGITVDITEKKRADQEMRETQKLESLGLLAGGIAHDFNNLLTGILGNASLALEAAVPGDPSKPLLEDVVNAGERAADLTRQLLAYAGKGRFIVEPIDISSVLRDYSRLLQASVPKNVELRLELDDSLPPLEADSAQIQQLIMNLIINAAEAVEEGRNGVVTVRTGTEYIDDIDLEAAFAADGLQPGSYVNLEITDNGRGMDPETMGRIFDPFFTTKFTGRGLGLAAAQGIVRGHKGVIKVYSVPGVGTTFRVLLPALNEHRLKEPGRPVVDLTGEGAVLVVDDEDVVRRTAKNALQRYGYTVITAANGQEAVELYRRMSDRISLVLLDMTMPLMDGQETLRELQAVDPSVRVILSSGFNEVEAIRRFVGSGLAGFVQKPYHSATLAGKVREILKGPPGPIWNR